MPIHPLVPALRALGLVAMIACTSSANSARAKAALPKMSPEDILTLRTLSACQIAADGSAVAYVVRQVVLASNSYMNTLTVRKASGEHQERTLAIVEKGDIISPRWTDDGRSLTYLVTADASTLWKRTLEESAPRVLFQHDTPIAQYEWSPGGQRLAFLAASRRDEESVGGLVYDPDEAIDEPFRELTRGTTHTQLSEVWIYDVDQRRSSRLWRPPTRSSRATRLVWSPDGTHLAISYWKATASADGVDDDLDIVAVPDGHVAHRITWPGRDAQPTWAPDGKSVAFVSEGESVSGVVGVLGRPPANVYVLNLANRHTRQATKNADIRRSDTLQWSHDNKLYGERSDIGGGALYRVAGGLFEVDLSTGQMAALFPSIGSLSSCSFAATTPRAACVMQDLRRPPEIEVLDLSTRTSHTLTSVNAHVARFALAPIAERKWTNAFGRAANAYILTPDAGTAGGPPYPAIFVLYGFSRRFIADAQWISSYPVESLVAHGFAVVMVNTPDYPFRYFDAESGLIDLVYSPLDTLSRGVELLANDGVVDRHRLGIMGWSRGCYIAALAIGRSDTFKAASCGDGYLWTPSRYWLSRGLTRFHMEAYFGGPPYGANLPRYDEVSPIRTAAAVKAAVMFEYVAENFTGLELYVALREHGVPSIYVAYPGESHVFAQPRHRLASMHRNIDWFRYWLLNQRHDVPEKARQYAKWDQMKRERSSPN